MQQHLESWLAARREADPDGVPIPRHVERELRGYLECGILAFAIAGRRVTASQASMKSDQTTSAMAGSKMGLSMGMAGGQ